MTAWLAHRNLPDDFVLGEECELREPGEDGGVVRCRGVDLLSEEVETHLNAGKQVARLATGTVRLRVIPRVGGKTVREKISWEVMTYGRDSSGKRQRVAQAKGATPEISLPAGWYLVYAHLKDGSIRHPIEVSAGRTFKYTLVKN